MRRGFSSCQLTARPLTQAVKIFEHYHYIVKKNSAAEDCHCLMSNHAMSVPKPKINYSSKLTFYNYIIIPGGGRSIIKYLPLMILRKSNNPIKLLKLEHTTSPLQRLYGTRWSSKSHHIRQGHFLGMRCITGQGYRQGVARKSHENGLHIYTFHKMQP